MADYSNSQIYYLLDVERQQGYVGSTRYPLDVRKAKHESAFQQWKKSPGIKHCASVKVLESGGPVSIALLEKWPCYSAADLCAREGYWLRRLRHAGVNCVNINMPGAIAHAGGMKAYMSKKSSEYYKKHHTSINLRRNAQQQCGCGGRFTLTNKAAHERTGRHQAWACGQCATD